MKATGHGAGGDIEGDLEQQSAASAGHNPTFQRTGARVGATVIPLTQNGREGAPKRRGPAMMLDLDETGVFAGLLMS